MLSGRLGNLSVTVTNARKNAFAVVESADRGMTTVIGPNGAYMTKFEPPKPSDAENFVRRGAAYYLPVWEQPQQRSGLVAPVAPQEEQDGDLNMGGDFLRPFDPLAEDEERRAEEGMPAQYKIVTRDDVGARAFRTVRKAEGVAWGQVYRRITTDTATGEILADEYVKHLPNNFNFHAILPGAPRNITTKYYCDETLGDDVLLDHVILENPEEHDGGGLAVPQQPTDQERALHN
jgi:hypothetical protein